MATNDEFGKRLATAREHRGLSQTALAGFCGMNAANINHFERGRRQPTPRNLVKLADALCVTTDYLVGLSDRLG